MVDVLEATRALCKQGTVCLGLSIGGSSPPSRTRSSARDGLRICMPGGRILDPFAGSGTTLEAARLEGYDATGIGVSPEIAERAARRLGVLNNPTDKVGF